MVASKGFQKLTLHVFIIIIIIICIVLYYCIKVNVCLYAIIINVVLAQSVEVLCVRGTY